MLHFPLANVSTSRKSNVTKYNVTIPFTVVCDDEYEAANNVYRTLSALLASPMRGEIVAEIENADTGEVLSLALFDGVVEVDPLFASQVMGFRHLVWVSQNPPRSSK